MARRVHTAVRLGQGALDRVRAIAEAEGLPASEVLRRLLKLGLGVYEQGRQPRWNQ